MSVRWSYDAEQSCSKVRSFLLYIAASLMFTICFPFFSFSSHVITEDATPGDHILHCEIMKETKDPGGGTEFRIVAVDAL